MARPGSQVLPAWFSEVDTGSHYYHKTETRNRSCKRKTERRRRRTVPASEPGSLGPRQAVPGTFEKISLPSESQHRVQAWNLDAKTSGGRVRLFLPALRDP